jgi:heme-degrading monooxygenase HmoA
MIEVTITWNLKADINSQAYEEFANKATRLYLNAPGFVEFRVHRNLLGSPTVRATYVWQSLADWAKFFESAELQALGAELRTFATDIETQLWGPSPIIPEPQRPGQ